MALQLLRVSLIRSLVLLILGRIQQFETGQGDYSAGRVQWLPKSDVQDLAREIREQRGS